MTSDVEFVLTLEQGPRAFHECLNIARLAVRIAVQSASDTVTRHDEQDFIDWTYKQFRFKAVNNDARWMLARIVPGRDQDKIRRLLDGCPEYVPQNIATIAYTALGQLTVANIYAYRLRAPAVIDAHQLFGYLKQYWTAPHSSSK